MALPQVAVEYVLKLEDPSLSGIISDIPGDVGGKTRFGIASKFHPELKITGFYGPMPRGDALLLAGQVLQQQYADPMKLSLIDDQPVANVLLSYAVNDGVETAIKTMQNACNQVYPLSQGVAIDGQMGPQTLAAINRVMPTTLVNAFRLLVIGHYAEKAAANTLRGLIRRALA